MSTIEKKLPVGIDFFEKNITSGYSCIDTTMFIKTLVDMAGEVSLSYEAVMEK